MTSRINKLPSNFLNESLNCSSLLGAIALITTVAQAGLMPEQIKEKAQ